MTTKNDVHSDDGDQKEQIEYLQEMQQRGKIREKLKHTLESMEYLQPELSDIKKQKFQSMNEDLNSTFENIKHPRELTLDAVGMKILSSSLKIQALKLSDLSKQYNFDAFAIKLKDMFSLTDEKGAKQYGGDAVDWTLLGIELSKLTPSTIPFTTMIGPFQKEEKVRKPPQRKKNNSEDEDIDHKQPEKPKEIVQDGESDQNEATNERVKKLNSYVIELSEQVSSRKKRKRADEVNFIDKNDSSIGFDLLRLLVDPTDDVQTIENFFDFSFLIKEKKVMNALNDDDLPIAFAAAFDESDEKIPKKQMVLTLTTKDLGQIREMLYGDEGKTIKHPLHRDDEIYKHSTSSSSNNNSSSTPGKENSLNQMKQEQDQGKKSSSSSSALQPASRKQLKLK